MLPWRRSRGRRRRAGSRGYRMGEVPLSVFFFFFTLVTGPRRSLSLNLSDARVYEPQIRACRQLPTHRAWASRLAAAANASSRAADASLTWRQTTRWETTRPGRGKGRERRLRRRSPAPSSHPAAADASRGVAVAPPPTLRPASRPTAAPRGSLPSKGAADASLTRRQTTRWETTRRGRGRERHLRRRAPAPSSHPAAAGASKGAVDASATPRGRGEDLQLRRGATRLGAKRWRLHTTPYPQP